MSAVTFSNWALELHQNHHFFIAQKAVENTLL